MCAKDEYEKPDISVCFYEQVVVLKESPDNELFDLDNIVKDDFE